MTATSVPGHSCIVSEQTRSFDVENEAGLLYGKGEFGERKKPLKIKRNIQS